MFRRLRELEEMGLLTRERSGHRPGGAPLIVGHLHLDVQYSAPQMASEACERQCQSDTEGECQSDTTSGGSATGDTEAVPTVALHIENSNLNSKITTTTFLAETARESEPSRAPASGNEGLGEKQVSSDSLDHAFGEFLKAYPFDATMNPDLARSEFGRLSIKDRSRAVRWARRYREDSAQRGRTQPVDAAKWLRERRFDHIETIETARANDRGLAKPEVFVVRGTPPWDAWMRFKGKSSHVTTEEKTTRKIGWYFPSLWPPGSSETGPPREVA